MDKLEFTSERKRMSVIVKFPGIEDKYIMFTKGADSVMFELELHPKEHDLLEPISFSEEIEKKITKFSS